MYVSAVANLHLLHHTTLARHTQVVRAIAWHPSQPLLASGGKDRSVYVWHTATWQIVAALHMPAWATSLVWLDADCIMVGGSDGVLRWWNTSTQQIEQTHKGHAHWISAVALQQQLASASTSILLSSATPPQTLQGHTGRVTDLAWHPHDPYLASVGEDQQLLIWNTSIERIHSHHKDHSWYLSSVAWHASGAWIASGSLDESIAVYAWPACQLLLRTARHPDWVRSLAWHPQHLIVAAGCKNGQIWLWHLDAPDCFEPITTLQAHQGNILCIRWSPDGYFLASASEDTHIQIYHADLS